jgi:hypothetical protein
MKTALPERREEKPIGAPPSGAAFPGVPLFSAAAEAEVESRRFRPPMADPPTR